MPLCTVNPLPLSNTVSFLFGKSFLQQANRQTGHFNGFIVRGESRAPIIQRNCEQNIVDCGRVCLWKILRSASLSVAILYIVNKAIGSEQAPKDPIWQRTRDKSVPLNV